MSKSRPSIFVRLQPGDAAESMRASSARLSTVERADLFVPKTLSAVRAAVRTRQSTGCVTQPTSATEVGGLARAALGSDFEQMMYIHPFKIALEQYVVGALQVDPQVLADIDALQAKDVLALTTNQSI